MASASGPIRFYFFVEENKKKKKKQNTIFGNKATLYIIMLFIILYYYYVQSELLGIVIFENHLFAMSRTLSLWYCGSQENKNLISKT
jgi:hypothetical protein